MGICIHKQQPIRRNHQKREKADERPRKDHYLNSHPPPQPALVTTTNHEKKDALEEPPQERAFTFSVKVDNEGSMIDVPQVDEIRQQPLEPQTQPIDVAKYSIKEPERELKNQNPLSSSTSDIMIPDSGNLNSIPSPSFLDEQEERILISSNFCIQQYKNFSHLHLSNQQGQLVHQNIFTCFSLLIFELLSYNIQKLVAIKYDILRFSAFKETNLVQSQQIDMDEYGSVKSADEIKKLFLEYIVKILNKQSAVSIVESYSVLHAVLESIIITYVASKNPEKREEIYQKYREKRFDEDFMRTVAASLGLQMEVEEKMFRFKQEKLECRIYELEGGQCKGEVAR